MIDDIKLKNFKAFDNKANDYRLHLNVSKKNLLIYGDNGSGKSSIFEALKLSFYKRRILQNIIAPEEEKESVIQTVLTREYDNKNASGFEIKINDEDIQANSDIKSFDFELSLLNLYSVLLTNEAEGESKKDKYKFLNLKTLLKREFLSIKNIDAINYTELISNVNDKLIEFKEDIEIELDIDSNIKIDSEQYVNLYFNEAKINLVVLLLLFESLYLHSDNDKKQVIVLDDIITSLDMANRTFLLKYILERFNGDRFQLIILTHNLEVYRLVEYINNEVLNNGKFKKGQLFDIDKKIKFIDIDYLGLDTIKNKIDSEPLEAGNLIRKKFELLIHKLARELIIGSNDKADNIIKFLSKEQIIYLKKIDSETYHTANNLVLEIENKIDNTETLDTIKALINDYKISSIKMAEISDIVNNVKLYRKVVMNPLSHTEAPFAIKELYKSLDLLRRLDEMEFE